MSTGVRLSGSTHDVISLTSRLAQLEKKRGAKAAFARCYQPAFTELYLRNDGSAASVRG
jgi:hypothetical protein